MKTDSTHFDGIVIGGGSGGYAAARTLREQKSRVAIIDSAKELGGLCILHGCMPSKTLLYAGEILHLAQKGADFGLDISTPRADMPALNKRKRHIIQEFADYRQGQLQDQRFTLYRQQAHFVGPHTLALDDGTLLTADHFFIATGSQVAWPDIAGLKNPKVWTSQDVLDLDFVPEQVTILGGGIVACELAQFLNRIGSQVTLIQRSSQLLKEFSPAASTCVKKAFLDEGIRVYTDTQLQAVQALPDGFQVEFMQQGHRHQIESEYVLNALGRIPNTAALNLAAAGIECHANGHVRCSETQQTTNPQVYACGDVCGPHAIVHTAIMQGETAANHALQRNPRPVDYSGLVTVAFTDPQVATAGYTEANLIAQNIEYLAADYPFDDHGKSILMEALYGYVKVFCDRQGQVLGAECVGKDAGELIHAMAVAIQLKARVQDLIKVHWYHPTLSEIWAYPLEEIAETLLEAAAPTT